MFVEKGHFFEKKFYAKVEKSGRIIPRKVPDMPDARRQRAAIAELERDGYILHTVTFKLMNWGEYCKIMRECMRTDAETAMRFVDSYEVDTKKLIAVLQEWDFTRVDSKGETVKTKPDDATVRMLYPPVAEFLLKLYDEEGEVTQEMEKNS